MACHKVKEFLSQRNVDFVDRDVAANDAALADLEQLGYMNTPVTLIDGEAVVGFDRRKLEKLPWGRRILRERLVRFLTA